MWTVERQGAPATSVTLPVTRGDVKVPEAQEDAITTALDATVTVWSSPPAPPSSVIPLLHFGPKEQVALARLKALVQSRAVCILTSDFGTSYRVKFVGPWEPTFVATTSRLTKPRWEVTVTVVGV